MSQDWIAVRKSLWTDGRVLTIARATKMPKTAILGALFRLWSIADEHSVDGALHGWTADAVDSECEVPGFAASLASSNVGWLAIFDGYIRIPEFDRFMGQSAKRRLVDAKRKAGQRDQKRPQTVPPNCGQNADRMRTSNGQISDRSFSEGQKPHSDAVGAVSPVRIFSDKMRTTEQNRTYSSDAEEGRAENGESPADAGRVLPKTYLDEIELEPADLESAISHVCTTANLDREKFLAASPSDKVRHILRAMRCDQAFIAELVHKNALDDRGALSLLGVAKKVYKAYWGQRTAIREVGGWARKTFREAGMNV